MRRTLVLVMASLVFAVVAPATAAAEDGGLDPIPTDPIPTDPILLPSLCVIADGMELPPPGELPALQDAVTGESVGVGCGPEAGDFTTNADITVTNEVTTWAAERNGNNGPLTGQVQVIAKVSPAAAGDVLQGTSVTYKVTVRVAGQPDRTETMIVPVDRAVGGGAAGGYRNTTFNPPIPAKAKVTVELVGGTGWVQFSGVGNPRGFTIKAADQGTQDFPDK